jgi:transcriptional regulator with XRE-family HTH domain
MQRGAFSKFFAPYLTLCLCPATSIHILMPGYFPASTGYSATILTTCLQRKIVNCTCNFLFLFLANKEPIAGSHPIFDAGSGPFHESSSPEKNSPMITITDLMYSCKLRSLRQAARIKQFAAADLCGLECQQLYSNLENGKASFSEEIIRQIAAAFRISVTEFTRIDKKLLLELIIESGLDEHVHIDADELSKKHHSLYILECEKRLSEFKLESAYKDKLIAELRCRANTGYSERPVFVLA